jgi:hypothetical protein
MQKTRRFYARRGTIGVGRINLAVPSSLKDKIVALRERAQATLGLNISNSYMVREGLLLFIKKMNRQLGLAEKGQLHVKSRKITETI